MKMRTLMGGRTLLVLGVLAALFVPFAASGGTSATVSAKDDVTQRQADLYQIEQVEVKFHRATSKHNLNLMMSIWAPGAIFNIDQKTLTGKAQIRHWFATENKAFMPSHHWESDTPSYKIRTAVTGNKGTLYFECHYIDTKSRRTVALVGLDHNVQKINDKWLIVESTGEIASLSQ